MSDELTPAEVAEITGKKRAATQAAVLAKRGVPFVFHVNRVAVLRVVAVACGLVPEAPVKVAAPVTTFKAPAIPAGLQRWQAEQREMAARRAEIDAEHAEYTRQMAAVFAMNAKAQKRAIKALRRSAERTQTPPWADLNAIRAVYEEALRLTNATGVEHHVDHEIPLRGRLVSGLHVHQNLRVLPATANLSKGNKFEPC